MKNRLTNNIGLKLASVFCALVLWLVVNSINDPTVPQPYYNIPVKLLNTNLAFEYSTVDAEIDSSVISVKNPYSGRIRAKEIGEIIFDNKEMRREDTEICVEKEIK